MWILRVVGISRSPLPPPPLGDRRSGEDLLHLSRTAGAYVQWRSPPIGRAHILSLCASCGRRDQRFYCCARVVRSYLHYVYALTTFPRPATTRFPRRANRYRGFRQSDRLNLASTESIRTDGDGRRPLSASNYYKFIPAVCESTVRPRRTDVSPSETRRPGERTAE